MSTDQAGTTDSAARGADAAPEARCDTGRAPAANIPDSQPAAGGPLQATCAFRHTPDHQSWCPVCIEARDPQHGMPDPSAAVQTIQEQLERALRDYQGFLDNASVGIVLSAESTIVRYNPKFSEMFGYPGVSAIGLPGSVLYRNEEEYVALGRYAKSVLSLGQPVQRELYLRRRDASQFWANVFGYVADPGNPARGTWWIIEDRTQVKQNEEARQRNYAELKATHRQLEQTQAQLLHSEKMASIGQLAAGVAHEINTPIGFVNCNLGALGVYVNNLLALVTAYEHALHGLNVPPEVMRAIGAARRAADVDYLRDDVAALLKESQQGLSQVHHIVQGLNHFSHGDDGAWQVADLNDTIRSALSMVRNGLKHKAEVALELAELPPVYCNPAQIAQVLVNLLTNAAHAIGHEGRLVLRCGTEEGRVWLEVQDSGCGIAPELQARIFDPFFTTKPIGEGTGLGLSISYGIVSRHGGRFELDSAPGQGTRFRFWLPLAGPGKASEAAP